MTIKLLFLLSNDFGELANSFYFTKGYKYDSTFLLPPRLYTKNKDNIFGQVYCYKMLEHILEVIEKKKPHLIFLFSGYLYSINKVLSFEEVKELLHILKSKNYKVFTSDPFLGICSSLDDLTFNKDNPHHLSFFAHFNKVYDLLKELPHIYLSPTKTFKKIQQFSFFNHSIEVSEDELCTYPKKLNQFIPINLDVKQWLFILSHEDYIAQINRYGIAQFHLILQNKMDETVRLGRQPILLAPKGCIQAIYNLDTESESNGIYLSFCPYHIFSMIILEAEFLFLWNIFSNCLISRLSNRRPVFFFDKGHLAFAIPRLFELGIRHNYYNNILYYLDPLKPLEMSSLTENYLAHVKTFEQSRLLFKKSPSPDSLIEQFIDRQ